MFTETEEALSRLAVRRDAWALEILAWATVLMLGVTAFLVLNTVPAGSATSTQLGQLADDSLLYRLGFVAATIVNPLLVAALAEFFWLEHRRRSVRPVELIGWGFLIAYLPLISLAYVSQYTVLPRLLETDAAAAANWFFYEETSLPYLAEVLGYAMFGLGALLLSAVLVRRHGMVRWTGILLALTGLASVLGLVGMAIGFEVLEHSVSVGGFLVAPLAVMLAFDGRRCRKV